MALEYGFTQQEKENYYQQDKVYSSFGRDLINDYEKFLEIRKVLDPNDLWIDNFQHGYYVHPDLKKEVSK